MRLLHSLVAVSLGISAAAMHATPVTYSVASSGTGTYVSETETGSGSITFDANPGGTSTITAFSFTDTISGADGSSTFTYTFPELTGSSAVFANVSNVLTLTNLSFTTAYETGSNAAFGPVDFTGAYSGPSSASTGGSNAGATDFLADFTSGSLTLTPGSTAAAPEPESLVLLGTGLAGIAGAIRRRRVTA